jgi:hypothetical protein
MRLAFGTFLGLPERTAFMGDADYKGARWRADPDAAFAAEVVGSNFATNWGSVDFFRPLTTCPDLWNQGVGKAPDGARHRVLHQVGDHACRSLYLRPRLEVVHATHSGVLTREWSVDHRDTYQAGQPCSYTSGIRRTVACISCALLPDSGAPRCARTGLV